MTRILRQLFLTLLLGASACVGAVGQADQAASVQINWGKVVMTSKTTPTLQVVVNPMLERGAKLHDSSFSALGALGADYVRYVPWYPYPKLGVAELRAPVDGKTYWDFSRIDPMVEDFMQATKGHSVILNFSTMPAWMFKTNKPVPYPENADQVTWDYTQGTELRDPTMKEAADYYARLLSWYEKGGFRDEYGKWHPSGHHYKIAYWEVLNEIEFEHQWTPQLYSKFYDAVTLAMRKVDPEMKFMALALGQPSTAPAMFEYFLNPAHHRKGVPLDFITYHFYATPTADQTISDWQYSFFAQEEGFLNTVRYVEEIRKRLSPQTQTDLDELGVILPDDKPGATKMLEPAHYWNLAGALYADLYVQLTKLGIQVAGESQLVGYPSQFPSVSMMNYVTSEPNARFWTLKLLKDNFEPGDELVETSVDSSSITAQAFQTREGNKLLVINKRDRPLDIKLPADAAGADISLVAPSSKDHAPTQEALAGTVLHLEPCEIAVVKWVKSDRDRR